MAGRRGAVLLPKVLGTISTKADGPVPVARLTVGLEKNDYGPYSRLSIKGLEGAKSGTARTACSAEETEGSGTAGRSGTGASETAVCALAQGLSLLYAEV